MNQSAVTTWNSVNLLPTPILDIASGEVRGIVKLFGPADKAGRSWLQQVHTHLIRTIRPTYSVDEWQPASVTLRKGHGSCSQRMACLEAVGRAAGIPSRVRALKVKGSFWNPRFRLLRFFIPKAILLLWPQFFLHGRWIDFDELYAPLSHLASTSQHGFANDAESLFEAVKDTPVDFLGKTCGLACALPDYDLTGFVIADLGFFDARDKALKLLGSFQHTVRGKAFELMLGGAASSR